MIRILQISDSLKQRFGVTAFLTNYNSAIDPSRIIFDYLILDTEKEIAERIKGYGGEIYTMPKLGLTNYIEFRAAIEEFFSKHHYTVVHSHFYQIDFIVRSIAVKHGVKHYISHSHNTKYADSKARAIRNCLMAFPVRFTSTDYCACSVAAGRFLFGTEVLRMRRKELVVIPNAIHYDKFRFNEIARKGIRDEFNLHSKTVYGNVGSLKPQKNHEFLLEVFYEIQKMDHKSVLMLVGDGDLRKTIEKKAESLAIRHKLIFVGTSATPEEYYNAFDCYIFPSLYEGFGLSLLEAEVNGLPCVCADTIPKEAIISSSVSAVSLKDSSAYWAKICVEKATAGRKEMKPDRRFDLEYAADKLREYYESLN